MYNNSQRSSGCFPLSYVCIAVNTWTEGTGKLKQEGGWGKKKTVKCTGHCDTKDLIKFVCELPKLYVLNEFEEDIPPCFYVPFTVEH